MVNTEKGRPLKGRVAVKSKKVPPKGKDVKPNEKKLKEPTKAALKKVKDAFDFESDTKSETASVTSENSQGTEVEVLSLADRLKKSKYSQHFLHFKKKLPVHHVNNLALFSIKCLYQHRWIHNL